MGVGTISNRWLRVWLLALAFPLGTLGVWGLVAPRGFFDTFPGVGRHWVAALGPYDEHLVRDFTAALLGLALILALAARSLQPLLVRAALAGTLVWALPHFVFHATETGPLSLGDNIANLASLALTVLVPAVLLLKTGERRGAG